MTITKPEIQTMTTQRTRTTDTPTARTTTSSTTTTTITRTPTSTTTRTRTLQMTTTEDAAWVERVMLLAWIGVRQGSECVAPPAWRWAAASDPYVCAR